MKYFVILMCAIAGGIICFLLMAASIGHAHGLHGPDDNHGFSLPQPSKLEIVYDDRGVYGQTCEVYDRDGPCCPGELNPVGDVRVEGELCLPIDFPVNADTRVSGGVNSAGGDTRCTVKANGKLECRVAAAHLRCLSDDMTLTLAPLGGDCYSYKWRGKQQYITAPMIFSEPNHEWSVNMLFITEAPGEDVNDTGLWADFSGVFPGTDFKCLNDDDRRECGDGNGDGDLNVSDSLVVLRTSVGSSFCGLRSCDHDGSLHVGVPDALHNLRAVVGMDSRFDCPQDIDFHYSGPVAGGVQFDVDYEGDSLGDCTSGAVLAVNDPGEGSATVGVISTTDLNGLIASCRNLLNPDEITISSLRVFGLDGTPLAGGTVTAALR